jgi:hypothetical protein
LSVVGVDGMSVGARRKSACGLIEPRSIHRNGPTMSTSPPTSRT